jgi:hypothetical protein
MEGEPKREMHELLPPALRPRYLNVMPSEEVSFVLKKIAELNISYPLIVKPEVGGQGILFRKINNEAALINYHNNVPVEYVVQEFVKYPLEISLFYYRFPGESRGVVTGFLQKIPLQVTGDGIHTIEELIAMHPKAQKRKPELMLKHSASLKKVLVNGETFMLSYAANHNQGAHFIDLKDEIDNRLTNLLDKISHQVNDFFYGRYDIMCNSIEELKQGKNFAILEYNGCGAEPNHFYDTGYTLMGAWKEILKHWKILYRISRENHKAGVQYWPTLKGFRFVRQTRKYYKKIKEADRIIP